MKSLFPEEMLKSSAELSLEGIASRLTYFTLQTWLIHWQTGSFAEHKNTDEVYSFLNGFKDSLMEKLMGYTGRKARSFKFIPTTDNADFISLLTEMKGFAQELQNYATSNGYTDVENMSQELSGVSVKALFLSTLS
jgi:hypothetical protein